MNKNATKLNAIKQLSDLWNIDLSEMTAFGDDYNDIEMIKYCGVGVAMANAIAEVLEAADVITETNDNDGVAQYISKHVLLDASV